MSVEENVEQLKNEFQKMDVNADGKLTRRQFMKILKTNRNIKNQFALKLLFYFTDSSDKYSIGFDSFVKLARESYQTEDFIRNLCKKMLQAYDANKDGEIDFEEFKALSEFINTNFPYTINYDDEEGFKEIDSNGDGRISVEEMEKFFQEKNLQNEEESSEKLEEYEKMKAKFAELDTDNDGLIDYEAFKELNKEVTISAADDDEMLEFSFSTMDKNRDDKISLDDVYSFINLNDELKDVPEEEGKTAVEGMFLRSMFYSLDKNKDGFIDFEEYSLNPDFSDEDSEKIKKEFNEIDLDKDGKISFEEMKVYIRTQENKS